MRKVASYVSLLVIGHAVIAAVHGAAHLRLEIWLSPLQTTFVALVISLAPFVALGFIWSGWARAGGAILLASMAGALLFGVVNHFVISSPDHVSMVNEGGWGMVFKATAVLLAASEIIGCCVGAWMTTRTAPSPLVGDGQGSA